MCVWCAMRSAGHQTDVRHQPTLAGGTGDRHRQRAADVGLFWLEDVTTCDDYAGLARMNQALSTPIAGGEYLWGITPFRQMIEARSVD